MLNSELYDLRNKLTRRHVQKSNEINCLLGCHRLKAGTSTHGKSVVFICTGIVNSCREGTKNRGRVDHTR